MREQAEELLPTRASLLHRLKDWRDQASWRKFFDTYWQLIYGTARKSGLNDAEAQDVVQETMLSVAKQMPGFTYDPVNGSFKKWLLNLTRWRIVDQVRKRAKAISPQTPVSQAEDTGTGMTDRLVDPASDALEVAWEAEWQNTLLTAALATVKRRVEPQTYQVFDFYVNKEWPARKVASTFNINVEQVYLAKHRVTEMLKAEVARLEREGA